MKFILRWPARDLRRIRLLHWGKVPSPAQNVVRLPLQSARLLGVPRFAIWGRDRAVIPCKCFNLVLETQQFIC
jgi:hypothetical protein